MSDYCLAQLKTSLLVKHLNELNALWEEHIVLQRIYELDEEYAQTGEYQERSAGQEQLLQQLLENGDKQQRRDALIDFDSVNGSELSAAKKYFYLAGMKDAMRMFNVSNWNPGDIPLGF
jgi:hypothetical protein